MNVLLVSLGLLPKFFHPPCLGLKLEEVGSLHQMGWFAQWGHLPGSGWLQVLWVTVAVRAGVSSTYFWRAECVTCPFRAGITPCLGTYLKLVSGYSALLLIQCPEMPLTGTPAFFFCPSASNMIPTFITPKSSDYEESPVLFFVLSYLLSISKLLS